MLLKNFHIIRPTYESSQEQYLNWLVSAHVKACSDPSLHSKIQEKIWHVGCSPEHIAKRGHVLADFHHENWEEMELYRLDETATGKNLSARTILYEKEVDKILERYYPDSKLPPDDLIHVSCTGYVSPNPAQKIVSKRGWGEKTTVTNAYHMGCYASLPAIRMGIGFLKSGKNQVDVVHTEICSLHGNPSLFRADRFVSESLFADGFIKYSVGKTAEGPHIELIAVREEIIPNSIQAMTWHILDWGFEMTLTKEVPVLITRHLTQFLNRLIPNIPSNAFFAVHPGGPKILNYVQQILNLDKEQMKYSFQILKECGNMSSATLPHIWEKIVSDPEVPIGAPVISLAFGPGLTIAGAYMVKRCTT